jgi:hypothetical protein
MKTERKTSQTERIKMLVSWSIKIGKRKLRYEFTSKYNSPEVDYKVSRTTRIITKYKDGTK